MTKLPELLTIKNGYYGDHASLSVNGEEFYTLEDVIYEFYLTPEPSNDPSIEVQIEDTDRKFLILKPDISPSIRRALSDRDELGYTTFDIQIILHDQSDNTFYCYPANLGSFGIELGKIFEVTPREITVTTYEAI